MPLSPLLVLRHGQTEWNAAARMQGRADSALTETGKRHAQDQGRILKQHASLEDSAIFCSPSGRARETAAICLANQVERAVIDPRLAEIDMGDWTGLFHDDLATEFPQFFDAREPLKYYRHIPNGESISDVAARVDSFLAEIEQPSIIVTHGITSRIMRCRAMARPATWFDRQPGGQGIVYRIVQRRQERLIAS